MSGDGANLARNMKKGELGGVIFGCTATTIGECLSKLLFGLPAHHFVYIKNIDPGLTLFLFNYTERKLYGIFEAASKGQMNIDPYGWTYDGFERTPYPAQVQVHLKLPCKPLREHQFKPIIGDNYFTTNRFFFELDHTQTRKLRSLFASFSVDSLVLEADISKSPKIKTKTHLPGSEESIRHTTWFTDLDDKSSMLRECPSREEPTIQGVSDVNSASHNVEFLASASLESNHTHTEAPFVLVEDNLYAEGSEANVVSAEELRTSCDMQSTFEQLIEELKELRAFKKEHSCCEQKLVEAENEIRRLKARCKMLDSYYNSSKEEFIDKLTTDSDSSLLDPMESIYLLGGFDGERSLPDFDVYYPSQDVIKPLNPFKYARSYASVSNLRDDIYLIGGGDGQAWFDHVEAYNLSNFEWSTCPSLNQKKGNLAAVSVDEKIFAIGGGNGRECFSQVEMLDMDVGRWIPARSMLQRRFAVAATVLDGIIYATGGYDGNDYLRTAERFDPREHAWRKITNMNSKRGCHSLVSFNHKLYALGGYDGNSIVQTTDVFEPRVNSWINGDAMCKPRGYAAAVALQDAIYVFGGVNSDKRADDSIVDTVDVFREGEGWKEFRAKAFRRCFLSAIAC